MNPAAHTHLFHTIAFPEVICIEASYNFPRVVTEANVPADFCVDAVEMTGLASGIF